MTDFNNHEGEKEGTTGQTADSKFYSANFTSRGNTFQLTLNTLIAKTTRPIVNTVNTVHIYINLYFYSNRKTYIYGMDHKKIIL